MLLVPDMYERAHVREMIAVLLDQLGFGAAFAVQVRNLSCVEEKYSLPSQRYFLSVEIVVSGCFAPDSCQCCEVCFLALNEVM